MHIRARSIYICWLVLSADMYQYENSLLFQCTGVTLEDKGYCEFVQYPTIWSVSWNPTDLSFSWYCWSISACHRYIGVGAYVFIEHNANNARLMYNYHFSSWVQSQCTDVSCKIFPPQSLFSLTRPKVFCTSADVLISEYLYSPILVLVPRIEYELGPVCHRFTAIDDDVAHIHRLKTP